MTHMIKLKDHIRGKREASGLSQDDVAKTLGMDRPNYVKYETGKRPFSLKLLKKIALIPELRLNYAELVRIKFDEHLETDEPISGNRDWLKKELLKLPKDELCALLTELQEESNEGD